MMFHCLLSNPLFMQKTSFLRDLGYIWLKLVLLVNASQNIYLASEAVSTSQHISIPYFTSFVKGIPWLILAIFYFCLVKRFIGF